MQLRKLGRSTLEIAPLAFGGNVFGWTLDEQASFTMLDGLTDIGLNMVDTADVYSAWVPGNRGGESETIIGNWLRQTGKRDRVVLATKVGMPLGDGSKGLSADNIMRAAEHSLRRLQTDYIDLYYAHLDDPDVPFEESLEAFSRLIDAGKVRYIASSNFEAPRLQEALTVARSNGLPQFVAHQPEYNLYDRSGYEGELQRVCTDNNLGVVTYFSLASGYLSGKYRTLEDVKNSKRGEGFVNKYMTPRGERIISALTNIAGQHQVPVASVALAWLIQRPGITAPIASATSMEQLNELAIALELMLTESDMAVLDQASAPETET
ncbi:MAG: alcohol dehydrogenase [Pseudomonadales bacterium]|nr:alcohol dehydrogenase [Pseudomonadales bacterium]